MDPVALPKQLTSVTEVDNCIAVGSLNVVLKTDEHPFASFIVTEKVPALSPLISSVIALLDHVCV